MKRREYVLMLSIAMLFGFVGGLISGCIIKSSPVLAQNPTQPDKVIQAKRFEVVDELGNVRAVLGVEPDRYVINARNKLEDAISRLPETSPLAVQYRRILKQIATANRVGLSIKNSQATLQGIYLGTTISTKPPEAEFILGDPNSTLEEDQIKLDKLNRSWENVNWIDAPIVQVNRVTPNDSSTASMSINPDGMPSLGVARYKGAYAVLILGKEGPSFTFEDNSHFKTEIGNTPPGPSKAGSLENRNAASVVLFDMDQNIIWKAP